MPRWSPRLARLFALSLGILAGMAGTGFGIEASRTAREGAIAGTAWGLLTLALVGVFRRRGPGTWGLAIVSLLLGLLGWWITPLLLPNAMGR